METGGVVVSVSAYIHGILDIFPSHNSNSVVHVRMAVLFPMGIGGVVVSVSDLCSWHTKHFPVLYDPTLRYI